jgi:hypothetical protein
MEYCLVDRHGFSLARKRTPPTLEDLLDKIVDWRYRLQETLILVASLQNDIERSNDPEPTLEEVLVKRKGIRQQLLGSFGWIPKNLLTSTLDVSLGHLTYEMKKTLWKLRRRFHLHKTALLLTTIEKLVRRQREFYRETFDHVTNGTIELNWPLMEEL